MSTKITLCDCFTSLTSLIGKGTLKNILDHEIELVSVAAERVHVVAQHIVAKPVVEENWCSRRAPSQKQKVNEAETTDTV